MTDLMRKVLVAGAAVAALSLAACNKPAPVDASNTTTTTTETTNTMAPAENAMAPADNAMAPAANSAS